ncbi:MAG TPA: glycosyltransferase family 1 protein [Bryobacteraceae bacterium]|nr:glycosyltransferase family 1 protein [Bryobacteraceae bacterium]
MKVALDATPLVAGTGGVPRYVRELHRALQGLHSDDEFAFLTDQGIPGSIGPRGNWLERRWWMAGLPIALRRHRFDVFHGTEFAVPYVPVCASVLSLHDLSPWMDAAWHGAGVQRVRQRTPWLLRAGLATMVLTLSEAVRRRAITHFRLAPDRVVAVPLAASPTLQPVRATEMTEPYFLYVGTMEPRKNLPMLVEAWRAVRARRRVRLVLAGRRREDGPRFEPGDGLEILGPVPEEDLAALYSGALAVVYPTFYEGFGLPVIEAMQCGAPVVTSLDESVVEVAGGAAIHCNASSPHEWAEALTRLLEQPSWREELRAAGLERSKQFTWARTARETLAVYRKAYERFR